MTAMPPNASAPSLATLPLDPLRFPLWGSRLIEASAGTGKTYTIAALYLRLVLQHGGEQAFGRPLAPPDILVVTFTDAATQELRDRIRHRLSEAAQLFAQDPEDAYGDERVDPLLAQVFLRCSDEFREITGRIPEENMPPDPLQESRSDT